VPAAGCLGGVGDQVFLVGRPDLGAVPHTPPTETMAGCSVPASHIGVAQPPHIAIGLAGFTCTALQNLTIRHCLSQPAYCEVILVQVAPNDVAFKFMGTIKIPTWCFSDTSTLPRCLLGAKASLEALREAAGKRGYAKMESGSVSAGSHPKGVAFAQLPDNRASAIQAAAVPEKRRACWRRRRPALTRAAGSIAV